MNNEINSLLNVQKEQLNKIEETKVLLLGSGSEDSKYDHIKEAFGWNDTDRALRQETNKVMEIAKRVKENVDSNVLSEEILLEYCIKNNYALTNVREYKGRIPEELLEAIDTYCKNNDRKLSSESNIQNLFILCQFTDTRANNDNLKKSKRYKKSQLPKIILLEKLDKGNAYSETHYKTIVEVGEKKPISNLVKSIFLTHTKVLNHLIHLIGYSIIVFLIVSLTGTFCKGENLEFTLEFCKWFIYIPFIVLVIKSIIPWNTDCHYNDIGEKLPKGADFPNSNYYNVRDEYVNISKCSYSRKTFLTSFMHNYNFSKRMLIIRNQLAFWIMNFTFLLVFLGINHSFKMYHLKKHKYVVIDIAREKAPDKINDVVTSNVYKVTGPFSYSKKQVKQTTGHK